MNEKNDFALVLRPLNALEEASPGAKRIIISMVAETLIVARRKADEAEALYHCGLELQRSADHDQAVSYYKKAAETGHLIAQYKLGRCYLYGEGVALNVVEAIKWLQKSLDGGFGRAGLVLGNHFSVGSLLPDYHEAQKCFQRGVDLGDEYCVQKLADVREKLGKADETAVLQRAAEGGNADASFKMATRCLEGIGVPQSAMEAFRWFREAAEQGDDVDAWCYMGFMLENGQGVSADLPKAIECYRHASELGNDAAYSRLIELGAED